MNEMPGDSSKSQQTKMNVSNQDNVTKPQLAEPPIIAEHEKRHLGPRRIPRAVRLAITVSSLIIISAILLSGHLFGHSNPARKKELNTLNALCSLNLPSQFSQAETL